MWSIRSRGSVEGRVGNAYDSYDTLQVLARQHVRRAEHWRYASSTVFNFGNATAQGRVLIRPWLNAYSEALWT